MSLWRLLPLLLCFCGDNVAATAASASQFPFEFLAAPALKRDRKLRGLPGASLGSVPSDNGVYELSIATPQDEPVDMFLGGTPPVADGPLRDLLDIGSALGTGVLFDGVPMPDERMDPVSSALDALHVKMRDSYPTPLRVHDANNTVHILGTLPKKLTPKTLTAAFSGGDRKHLVVRYFLGKDTNAKNVVGVEEVFDLDFSPVEEPTISYKASSGDFELVLKRPDMKLQKQVAINFENVPAVAMKTSDVKTQSHTVATGTAADAEEVEEDASANDAAAEEVASADDAADEDASEGADDASAHDAADDEDEASEEAVQEAHAAENRKRVRELIKERRKLREIGTKESQKQVADRAKGFISDAHLDDARKVLKSDLKPDAGPFRLVMLEMNHHS